MVSHPISGGFRDEREVRSSKKTTDLSFLRSIHEEADTRLVLHAVHCEFNTVVVSSRDTDVLLLLVSHFPRARCKNLWLMSGTSKKRRYIPIEAVFTNLPKESVPALLPFHALMTFTVMHNVNSTILNSGVKPHSACSKAIGLYMIPETV